MVRFNYDYSEGARPKIQNGGNQRQVCLRSVDKKMDESHPHFPEVCKQ